MADVGPEDVSLSPMPPPPDDGSAHFSDDPVEHSTLSATFMMMLLVTWLIFGHKIQGMFHWCAPQTCAFLRQEASLLRVALPGHLDPQTPSI